MSQLTEKQKEDGIRFAVNLLSETTGTDPEEIVEALTGLCWDEEEAGMIEKDLDQ